MTSYERRYMYDCGACQLSYNYYCYFITLYIAGWVVIYSYFMAVLGIVKTAVPRCRGQLDALLPETERPRAMVHRAVHGTEG